MRKAHDSGVPRPPGHRNIAEPQPRVHTPTMASDGPAFVRGPDRDLGDGIPMPVLGLGVWQMAAGSETEQAVEWALEAGYRHIDTAQMYRNERSVRGAGAREGPRTGGGAAAGARRAGCRGGSCSGRTNGLPMAGAPTPD